LTTCAELDAAGGVAGAELKVDGACASATDIINPLTAAKTTVLLIIILLEALCRYNVCDLRKFPAPHWINSRLCLVRRTHYRTGAWPRWRLCSASWKPESY
jgi:hypothetical protein